MQILLEFKIIASAALNMSECSILCTNWEGCAEKTTFYAERREPIFGEKKLMGISFMRREGVLRVNLRGFLQGFFKGEKRKKDSVILYTAKSMFRKKNCTSYR